MSSGNILVIGGGIGGLSTAIALRQAGHAVTVLEIQPNLHSSVYGVGIIQPINALRALDVIGCARHCLDQGYAAAGWASILNQDGELVHEIPGIHIPGSEFPPMNGVTRPALHQILATRAKECGVNVEYDATITDLDAGEGAVRVTRRDGSSESVALVVGADGVRSFVRGRVLDPGIGPRYIGQSAFRVNVPREPEIDRILLQHGETGMAGFVPIGPELAYLFMNITWDRSKRLTPGEAFELLHAKLAPFGGITGRVRDRFIDDPAAVVFRPEEYMIAPRPWHSGRVVLIGDAVHTITPHLGQGAAQAIEDGIVLADVLTGVDLADPAAVDRSLVEYTDRRYERCKLIVEASVQIGENEMHPIPGFDQAELTQRVMESMAAPI